MSKREWFFKRGNARLSWKDAPDWAVAAAIDFDGTGYWYGWIPKPIDDQWWNTGTHRAACFVGDICSDWQTLIFERPKPGFTEIAPGIWAGWVDVEVCKPCKPVSPHIGIVCHCGHTVEMTGADETSYLTYLAKCPDCGVTWEVTWSA